MQHHSGLNDTCPSKIAYHQQEHLFIINPILMYEVDPCSQGKGPYTGVNDGTIIKVSDDGQNFETFAWTSSNRSDACGKSLEAEDACGRVLGLKFNQK
jgi:hypothetical protein